MNTKYIFKNLARFNLDFSFYFKCQQYDAFLPTVMYSTASCMSFLEVVCSFGSFLHGNQYIFVSCLRRKIDMPSTPQWLAVGPAPIPQISVNSYCGRNFLMPIRRSEWLCGRILDLMFSLTDRIEGS